MGIYNRYANMKIARPNENIFPKWIDHNGVSVLIHNEQEERALFEVKPEENPTGFGESLGTKEEYKSSLLRQAIELGIPARKTWGIEKLRKAMHERNS